MLFFKEVKVDELANIRPFLLQSGNRLCDFTAGDIFMWRNDLWTGYAIINGTLIIEKKYSEGKFAFMPPLGKDPEGALAELDQYCLAKKLTPAFYGLDAPKLLWLRQRYHHAHFYSDRGWADYLYRLSDLRDLPGKKYDSKRHNAHTFLKNNPEVVYRSGSQETTEAFLDFFDRYLLENQGRDISLQELNLSKEMVENYLRLSFQIGCFEKDGKIIGFSLGEIKGDTLFLHVEKALHAYPGIFQALESALLATIPPEVVYVNREDDVNIAGLRRAKLQLHPLTILEKSFLEVTNAIDLIPAIPVLTSPRLLLKGLAPEEKEDYARLSLDEINNCYWGYDYRYDLPENTTPDADYFAADLAADFAERTNVSFFLHDQEGHLVGEIALYGFSAGQKCSIGIRLFPEYQGKGYAKEAVERVLRYLKEDLFYREIAYEAYIENTPSIRLATKLGFTFVAQDRLRDYFRLTF